MDTITKQSLSTLEFIYDLYYFEDFCDSFYTLENAIKRAKAIIKDNHQCKGGYNIRLHSTIIAIY